MIAENKHIIQTQSIEINFNDIEDGFGLQNRIADVFYDRILPAIDVVLNEAFGKDDIFYIERLDIDCGMLQFKNWEEEWVDQTIYNLKNEIRKTAIKRKPDLRFTEELIFYLHNGFLPWNSRVKSITAFEQQLPLNQSLGQALRKAIEINPVVATRLAHAFPATFRQKLIKLIASECDELHVKNLRILKKRMEEKSIPQIETDRATFIALASSKVSTDNREIFNEEMNKIIEDKDAPAVRSKSFKKEEATIELVEKAIYIHDAGLVILLPFLPIFFENVSYTLNGQWINEQSRHHAVLTLQYIVSGSEVTTETELVFPKIICGIPVAEFIQTEEIRESAKIAAEELLTQVIHHWAALKSTGIQSFRNTFLQRKGKLSHVDDGWQLQVEPHAVDILLAKLPWGIGTIKLPWMNDIIFTEW